MEKRKWTEHKYKIVCFFSLIPKIFLSQPKKLDTTENCYFSSASHDRCGRFHKQTNIRVGCVSHSNFICYLSSLCFVTMVILAFLVFLQLIKVIPNKKPLYLLFLCLECFTPRLSNDWYCLIIQAWLKCYCLLRPLFKIENPLNLSVPLCLLTFPCILFMALITIQNYIICVFT